MKTIGNQNNETQLKEKKIKNTHTQKEHPPQKYQQLEAKNQFHYWFSIAIKKKKATYTSYVVWYAIVKYYGEYFLTSSLFHKTVE